MLDNDCSCKKITETVTGTLVKTLNNRVAEGAVGESFKRREQLFVSMAVQQQIRHARNRAITMGMAAVALAAAAVLFFGWVVAPSSNELPFVVENTDAPGKAGDWVETGIGESKGIRFEQGTRIQVGSDGAARIVESNKESVTLELSRGTMLADVKGNQQTRWKVNAGPFTVTVLGTVFDVTWDDRDSQLGVNVAQGIVWVQGAGLSEHGVRLLAGQQLRANGRSGVIEMNVPSDSEPSEKKGAPATSANSDFGIGDAETRGGGDQKMFRDNWSRPKTRKRNSYRGHGAPSKSGMGDSWEHHYKNKRFKDAVWAAERQGLNELYGSLSARELWHLADAARNAGRVTISNEALISLRNRFGKSKKARLAAFLIGRSAMDSSHSPTIASQWFERYLSEAPNGDMAEEAFGRLMTIYSQMNKLGMAQQIATQYLDRYPSGLYARRAQQLLQ